MTLELCVELDPIEAAGIPGRFDRGNVSEMPTGSRLERQVVPLNWSNSRHSKAFLCSVGRNYPVKPGSSNRSQTTLQLLEIKGVPLAPLQRAGGTAVVDAWPAKGAYPKGPLLQRAGGTAVVDAGAETGNTVLLVFLQQAGGAAAVHAGGLENDWRV